MRNITDHLHPHATGEPGRRTVSWMKLCCHPGIAAPHCLFLVILLALKHYCNLQTGVCHCIKTQHISSYSLAGMLLFSLDTAESIQEQSDTFISYPAYPVSCPAVGGCIFIPICNLSCSCLFIPCKSAAELSYQFIVAAGSREQGFKVT